MQAVEVVKVTLEDAGLKLPTLYPECATVKHKQCHSVDLICSAMAAVLGFAPADTFSKPVDAVPQADKTQRDPQSRSTIQFLGMAGFCMLAKPLQSSPDNSGYLSARWKAYCGTNNRAYQDPLPHVKPALMDYQAWITGATSVKPKWVDALLASEATAPIPSLTAQVLLIWKDYGMRAYNLMNEFTTVPSLALAQPAVYDQVVAFRANIAKLKSTHGVSFPYLGVRGVDLSTIHHRSYPDLYYCALHRAIVNQTLGGQGRFVMSDVVTSISKPMLDKLSKPLRGVNVGVTDRVAADRLTRLGFQIEEGQVVRAKKRRRAASDSDSSDGEQ
ncbi:MAG: nucleocapsid [Ixodes ricinus orinovirus-like virus 1]|uniref:Nucleocapsid n=1 Tax=Ixodes ricinus orinovirus-like virus 1 TaxID=2950736 RepID=A0AAE9LV26_9MONO|nr:MAG: nucleocapsid [Ixodes ricinus orinovirus-like virus 1]